MKSFSARTTIHAAPKVVWDLLTDAPNYPSWNTTVDAVEGKIALGERITVRAKINPGRSFPVRVTELVPEERMVWSGGMPLGLFKGVRTFTLTKKKDAVEVEVREVFSGLLSPLIERSIPDLQPAFDEFSAPPPAAPSWGAPPPSPEEIRDPSLRCAALGARSILRGASQARGGVVTKGAGTKASPWTLSTPSGGSEYTVYRDETLDPPALVVKVGKTELRYQLRCIEDLHAMLKKHGDWMLLGSADEQKKAAEGTVEAWGRSPDNPVGGWYGLKKGLRGRFGMYVPPVLALLGLAEVENAARNNRMRAI